MNKVPNPSTMRSNHHTKAAHAGRPCRKKVYASWVNKVPNPFMQDLTPSGALVCHWHTKAALAWRSCSPFPEESACIMGEQGAESLHARFNTTRRNYVTIPNQVSHLEPQCWRSTSIKVPELRNLEGLNIKGLTCIVQHQQQPHPSTLIAPHTSQMT